MQNAVGRSKPGQERLPPQSVNAMHESLLNSALVGYGQVRRRRHATRALGEAHGDLTRSRSHAAS